jgi:peptidoglycan/LPS O-acetylase OafA/YrhL
LLDARNSPRYYTTFYARRAYRILPLYYLITLLFLLRHSSFRWLPGAFGGVSPLTIPWWSYLTFTQTIFMVGLGWFGPQAMTVTWSLAVEEQFYLATPLLLRKLRGRHLPWALTGIILAAPLLRFAIQRAFAHGGFACYVLMPCRADAFCLGVLSAVLVRHPIFWNQLLIRRGVLWSAIGILFGGIAFMTYKSYSNLTSPMTFGGYSWLAFFYTACMLGAISARTGIWHRILCHPFLMRLGMLAYCVYLMHFPLILGGRRMMYILLPFHPEIAFVTGALLGVAATIVLATISWRFFEKPMLLRGHRYRY